MIAVAMKEKATEVCNVMKNKGFDYSLDPFVIGIIANLIVSLIKLFIKLYGKKDLLEKLNNPNLIGSLVIKRRINSYAKKLDKFYEPGVENKIGLGLKVMFNGLDQDGLQKLIKSCGIKLDK